MLSFLGGIYNGLYIGILLLNESITMRRRLIIVFLFVRRTAV